VRERKRHQNVPGTSEIRGAGTETAPKRSRNGRKTRCGNEKGAKTCPGGGISQKFAIFER